MITVTPQEEDITAVIWLKRKLLFTGKSGLRIWFGAAGPFIGFGLIIIFGSELPLPVSIGYWAIGIYLGLWLLAGLSCLLTPIQVKRIYKKHNVSEMTYSLEWDHENLISGGANFRTLRPWREYSRWLETKRIFALYKSDEAPVYIPKRVLNEKQLQELRGILLEAIGRKGVTRK